MSIKQSFIDMSECDELSRYIREKESRFFERIKDSCQPSSINNKRIRKSKRETVRIARVFRDRHWPSTPSLVGLRALDASSAVAICTVIEPSDQSGRARSSIARYRSQDESGEPLVATIPTISDRSGRIGGCVASS